jgi:predicted metal-dependent hydrolase
MPERDELVVNGERLRYAIRVSRRRRTLCLRLYPDGEMQVVAPGHARLADVRHFVRERGAWIERKRLQWRGLAQDRSDPCADGRVLPLLGARLQLRHRPATRPRPAAERIGDTLLLPVSTARGARPLVEAWYRRQAHTHVAQRIAHFAPLVGRAPARISIRAQRTRWGSCSGRGTISINWRLMLASPEVLDYVIVHELCHLLQANHSARFWREVARVMPEYARHQRALREFGRQLVL